MRDAFGRVQSLVVAGGASDIGAAIALRFVRDGCRKVLLAGRHPERMEAVAASLRSDGGDVALDTWDVDDLAGQAAAAQRWFGDGDVDCVVMAVGVLGSQEAFDADPEAAGRAAVTNYAGPVACLQAVSERMRAQGHGTIVVLSSVAGERTRRSNYVYGSTKAGLDAYAQGLADALHDTGVRVLVVRPGFVVSKMTEGLEQAPMSTTPDAVADAVVRALATGAHTVWVPSSLRLVMTVFRHLPRPVFRRVAGNR